MIPSFLNYTQQFTSSAMRAPGFKGASSYWQNNNDDTFIVISDWSSTDKWQDWSNKEVKKLPQEAIKSTNNDILISTKKPNDIFLL